MTRSRQSRPGISAFQRLKKQFEYIDSTFEIRDARAPESSCHPYSNELFSGRPRIVILSHQDLADPIFIKEWIKLLKADNTSQVLAVSLKHHSHKSEVINTALQLTKPLHEKLKAKGLLPRPIRACVVGLPNVGKSSFINWLIGRHKTVTGNRPGITKGTQWIKVSSQFELLDTPGILPPASFSNVVETKLALLNVLSNHRFHPEQIANWGVEYFSKAYPTNLKKYGLDLNSKLSPLEQVAILRNFRTRSDHLDLDRAALSFLKDVREGRVGKISLDVAIS